MKITYDFDEIIDRRDSECVKYDLLKKLYGNKDLLPMWVADMDFRTPDFILKAINKRLEHPILGYSYREKGFTESVVNWMKKRHNWEIQAEWVLFTPGVVPALNFSVLTFSEPGDKIIVQPPVYFPFFSAITDHGRIKAENPLLIDDNEMKIDFSTLDSDAKMFFLSSPHNPGGMVWKKDELRKLGEFCVKNKILLVSDEIHSDLVLFGNKHIPIASISPEIADTTIACMAPSKTFNIAGLSSSVIIISNEKLREKFYKTLNSYHISMGNIFGSIALETAYNQGEEWLNQLVKYLEKNISFAIEFFEKNMPEFKIIKPESTYMLWIDCRELGLSNKELKKFFTEDCKLALSDGRQFGKGGDGFQRMNLACPKSVLQEALDSIFEAYKNVTK